MARIFLCHASEDKSQVREVYQRLKALGFEPWLDEEDLLPGQDWAYEIPLALKASDFILIFFSSKMVSRRGYVHREMRLALDALQEMPAGEIFTIPVRLDECEVPELFRRYHYANLFDARGFDRLVAALHHGIEQRGEQIPESLETPPAHRESTTTPSVTELDECVTLRADAAEEQESFPPQSDASVAEDHTGTSTTPNEPPQPPDTHKTERAKSSLPPPVVTRRKSLYIVALVPIIGIMIFAVVMYTYQAKPEQKVAIPETEEKKAPPPPELPKTVTKRIGMEFVRIPAGTFTMGSPDSDPDADDDEKPAHQVTISQPFYMGKYEVTQAQWKAVMSDNPSRFKGDDRPVENVSWNDVQQFIKKLNAMEGKEVCRLPTEAEWEYGARAGTTTRYSFGDDASQLKDYGWYDANSGNETHPVGQKKPNAWGLYDMHGNVWEWVRDGKREYKPNAVTDPRGPDTGANRVHRGGSWVNAARHARSAFRRWYVPGLSRDRLGFRCSSSG